MDCWVSFLREIVCKRTPKYLERAALSAVVYARMCFRIVILACHGDPISFLLVDGPTLLSFSLYLSDGPVSRSGLADGTRSGSDPEDNNASGSGPGTGLLWRGLCRECSFFYLSAVHPPVCSL